MQFSWNFQRPIRLTWCTLWKIHCLKNFVLSLENRQFLKAKFFLSHCGVLVVQVDMKRSNQLTRLVKYESQKYLQLKIINPFLVRFRGQKVIFSSYIANKPKLGPWKLIIYVLRLSRMTVHFFLSAFHKTKRLIFYVKIP